VIVGENNGQAVDVPTDSVVSMEVVRDGDGPEGAEVLVIPRG
jgi:Tfp pilus assembly protein PilP